MYVDGEESSVGRIGGERVGAFPDGGRDVERSAFGAGEGAGEGTAVELNDLGDFAAVADADAAGVRYIGVPDGIFAVGADAVRCPIAEAEEARRPSCCIRLALR